ncbi:WD40 repeat protein [Bradymonas sediminis]|uniref:Uncharacterized protein n=1 Tax=Bradymonas sediminis TaxID=1548548 RepID=A0A2Z4FIJ2_9DELT|nr:hypothetical protein DN745_05660 [Bradymonas sediminis]TDP71853.1 WD40 repeat protein [Bradymonas sediminis]
MRRAVLITLSLLVCASFGVACGDSDGSDAPTEAVDAGDKEVREEDAGQSDTAQIDGPAIREINVEGGEITGSRFSPDGSKLLGIYHYDDEQLGDYAVVLFNTDGTLIEVLAEDPDVFGTPAWAPDGESIFYANNHFGVSQIKLEDSAPVVLFRNFSGDNLDVSPDAKMLLGSDDGISIEPIDASENAVQLNDSGEAARYSPDGTQIAYYSEERVMVMDADGGNNREVISGDMSYLTSVDWLPDGERLVVSSRRGIEIVEIASSTRETLIDGFATKDIDISSDGRWIVYGVNGQSALEMVELP